MGQFTIYLDDKTEQLIRRHTLHSGESTSDWIAEAVKKRVETEWPPDIIALFGSWADDDFPDPDALRADYGLDITREEL